ncbi:MAG TPA: NADH-quinone oxidoreductase subunit NuoH [Anaerolineales bacterium]|nr:NADH-quinone oxidoreductase subunit NuoH [Anaerolineales bacterium]
MEPKALETLAEVAIAAVIKSGILLVVLLTAFAYTTLLERKVMALLQVRLGPNRAGPGGFFQPVADGIKLFFKEELIPAQADRLLFIIAPVITVIPALIILAVVPFGPPADICIPTAIGQPDWKWVCYTVPLAVADLNVGLLYILSVASIAVYGIVLAGWSSANKYASLGGLRSTAQMVSYEIALGLSVVGPVLLTGSLSLTKITEWQADNYWIVLAQPIGALIFLLATLAEVNRAPFDMPEAEQELTAGYHTEYSGMKFALFFMAEYIKMVAVSAVGVTLFFGGYLGPFLDVAPNWLAAILGLFYFTLKTVFFLVVMIWVRATLPRLRYDQLMRFGWKVMLPLALANVAVTAVAMVVFAGKAG